MADISKFIQAAGAAGPGHEYASNAPTPADLEAIKAQPKGNAPIDHRPRQPQPLKSDVDRSPFHPTPSLDPLQLSSIKVIGISIDTTTRELTYSDDAAPVLKPLGDLLASTYKGLQQLGEYKAAAFANCDLQDAQGRTIQRGEWTEAASVLKVAEQAERAEDVFGKRWALTEKDAFAAR